MTDIDKLSRRYMKQGVMIVAVLFLITWFAVGQLFPKENILTPLLVCTVYALVFELAEGKIWARIAKHSPDNLPNFFMAVSVFRMLSTLILMFVYYLVAGRSEMIVFIVLFAVFYIAQLAHHICFFPRKNINVTNIKSDK
ncbi:MAG: hypothetical protein SPI30_06600 [Prevotella sp.]|nr:hypothetical protein [Prevotella sp.]